MKISRIYCLLILTVVSSLTSCDKDENIYPQLGEDPRNLDQIISDTPELSTLSEALIQVNLDSVIRSTSTYTFFAPTNSAFDEIEISGMTAEELENVILNHLISTVTADFASTLSTGYRTTMATGPDGNFLSLFINAEGGTRLNDVASLGSSNGIGSTNGVLHIIDGVLVPPTVDDHVKANPDFSMLAEAIELAGLEEMLAANDGESEAFPLTLYAPTNAAFEGFIAQVNGAFGWSTLSDIPVDVLTQILSYHLVTGENTISAVIADTEHTTVHGDLFTVNAESIITDGSYTTTNFTLTDVQGINGVMHAIDKVLIPASIFQEILGGIQNLKDRSEDRGFTTFLAAIEKAGLTNLLEGEGMLTVFAPNNDAFVGLFASVENFESLDDFDTEEEIEVLKKLLTYHLHEGLIMSSQLTNGGTLTTVQGDMITADLTGENARLRPSYGSALPSVIVMANIGATNGIIHEINRVLVPAGFENILGFPSDEGGVCAVGDESLVFFDWDGKNPYWGNVQPENSAALSLDGSSYGRANFQTGGTGWQDLFWRNGGTLNGAEIVGNNLTGYSLKFDINVQEPINAGMFRIRFNNSSGVDAFYDWAPWEETGEPFSTDGWETMEIPLTALGQPDFSLVDAEFGMAFEGADVLLNFAIDNVRFDTPGGCSGPDPIANPDAVFFDWDQNGSYWGQVTAENDVSISLDGSSYGRANFQTGGTGWQDLFWRNDASTFHGADMVGTNIDDYVLKFDIVTFEPISEGMCRIRFNATGGVDAFYNWQPWEETGEPFDTEGDWRTVTIPVSALGQPDFSAVDAEFGMAFEGADVLLNFAIDNVRFEEK